MRIFKMTHQIVNEYSRPKQRMTRLYSYVIVRNPDKTGRGDCKYYSFQRLYKDDGSLDNLHPLLTYPEARKLFLERVEFDMTNYPPSCNEEVTQ